MKETQFMLCHYWVSCISHVGISPPFYLLTSLFRIFELSQFGDAMQEMHLAWWVLSSLCMWWVPPPFLWYFWDLNLVLSLQQYDFILLACGGSLLPLFGTFGILIWYFPLFSLHVVGPSSLWHFLSRIPRVVSHYGDTFFAALKWRLFVSHY